MRIFVSIEKRTILFTRITIPGRKYVQPEIICRWAQTIGIE